MALENAKLIGAGLANISLSALAKICRWRGKTTGVTVINVLAGCTAARSLWLVLKFAVICISGALGISSLVYGLFLVCFGAAVALTAKYRDGGISVWLLGIIIKIRDEYRLAVLLGKPIHTGEKGGIRGAIYLGSLLLMLCVGGMEVGANVWIEIGSRILLMSAYGLVCVLVLGAATKSQKIGAFWASYSFTFLALIAINVLMGVALGVNNCVEGVVRQPGLWSGIGTNSLGVSDGYRGNSSALGEKNLLAISKLRNKFAFAAADNARRRAGLPRKLSPQSRGRVIPSGAEVHPQFREIVGSETEKVKISIGGGDKEKGVVPGMYEKEFVSKIKNRHDNRNSGHKEMVEFSVFAVGQLDWSRALVTKKGTEAYKGYKAVHEFAKATSKEYFNIGPKVGNNQEFLSLLTPQISLLKYKNLFLAPYSAGEGVKSTPDGRLLPVTGAGTDKGRFISYDEGLLGRASNCGNKSSWTQRAAFKWMETKTVKTADLEHAIKYSSHYTDADVFTRGVSNPATYGCLYNELRPYRKLSVMENRNVKFGEVYTKFARKSGVEKFKLDPEHEGNEVPAQRVLKELNDNLAVHENGTKLVVNSTNTKLFNNKTERAKAVHKLVHVGERADMSQVSKFVKSEDLVNAKEQTSTTGKENPFSGDHIKQFNKGGGKYS